MCSNCNEEYGVVSNFYRTKHFIVKQELSIQISDVKNILFSRDTFYPRNKKLEKQYGKHFKNKEDLNGKRITTSTYLRIYKK